MPGLLDDLIGEIMLDAPQPQPEAQPQPQPEEVPEPAPSGPSGGDVGNSLYGDKFLEHYGLKK